MDERRRGVPPRPRLCEWRRERLKDLYRAICFSSPPVGSLVSESAARRPMPHTGSTGLLASAKQLVPVFKRCSFMAVFCVNLARKDGVFPNAVPDSVFDVTHASIYTFCVMLALAKTKSSPLHHGPGKGEPSQLYPILLRAGVRRVVNDKRRGGPLRKIGGGLPGHDHLLR